MFVNKCRHATSPDPRLLLKSGQGVLRAPRPDVILDWFLVLFFETGFLCVALAGLELGDPSVAAAQALD